MKLDIDKLNFDKCEQEKILIPESIQGYGYLFAFNRDSLNIAIYSANTENIFGDLSLVGMPFFDLLENDSEQKKFLQETFSRVETSNTRLPIRIKFKSSLLLAKADEEYFAVVYNSGSYYVVELEPSTQFRERYNAEQHIKLYAMSIAPRFKSLTSLEEMAQQMVETIRYLTNMDRVVLYKFNSDHSGRVIAEAKDAHLESYMDLYFPASDIPPQARELYKVNWVRLVPDVDLPSSALLPSRSEVQREPLDMTHSLLRTLSPIHLQYVRNQGLKSSFSVSLVTGDNLYGLISCHSSQPKYISQDVRLQCENLSQLFSWHLLAKEDELLAKKKNDTDKAVDDMLNLIGPSNSIVKVIEKAQSKFLDAMHCDGFIYYSQGETITLGQTLPLQMVKSIVARASTESEFPYVIENLPELYSADELNGIAGIMIIPLFESKTYFTAWFRKERVQQQRWVGDGKETDANASKKERLTPRASFKVNVRQIMGNCLPFDQSDITTANRLNRMFLIYTLDAQERLQNSLANLKKQDQYRNEFLATLAHELRNPLTPVHTGVLLLESEPDAPVRKRVVAIIKRQAQYMSKLISDLMDVSRITRGKIKIDFERLNLEEIVVDSLEIVAEIIEKKSHRVSIRKPHKPLFVSGDKARLSQIFSNIIHNAAKYSEPGGMIEVEIESENEQAIISIIDNGLGIPADRLADVFEMFTQVDAHSTHTEGGLGIGLTLVKKLVSLHQGTISVSSEGIGSGSQFKILLPLVEPQEVAACSLQQQPKLTVKEQKVLFVDDNVDIVEAYCLLCEALGYTTLGITDPSKAQEAFKTFRPDVVFLDIGMPKIDGYELCGILQQITGSATTSFYALSGWGSKKDIERAKNAGFKQHFVKPVSLDDLKSVLEK